jgi:hypothetical protein
MSSLTGVCCISLTSGDITATPLTLSDCSTDTDTNRSRVKLSVKVLLYYSADGANSKAQSLCMILHSRGPGQ